MMMGKKKKKNRSVVKELPNEIEENILSRLPAKTILRFMSVCKSWYSLILNPYFINIHNHNHNCNKNNNNLPLFRTDQGVVVVDSSGSFRFLFDPQLNGFRDFERIIVGSHNGIVCVYGVCRGPWTNNCYYLCLWNPALKLIKMIRKGYLPCHNTRLHVGFGFHNSDYKVVGFLIQSPTRAEIYSLSSDSWRTVNVAPLFSERVLRGFHSVSHLGVYINKALHWAIVTSKCHLHFYAIISFDLEEEVFKEIIIPNECKRRHMMLFNYNGSLAMLTFSNKYYCACVWVMKYYGLPESWTKLCKIDLQQLWTRLYLHGSMQIDNMVIIPRSKYGVMADPIVFDIDKSEFKETNRNFMRNVFQYHTYRESLLLLDSFNKLKLNPS